MSPRRDNPVGTVLLLVWTVGFVFTLGATAALGVVALLARLVGA